MSADWSVGNERLHAAMARALREHWTLFLVDGIVLLILGILAVVVPPLATLAVTVFLGWLFVISGLFGFVTTFGARHASWFLVVFTLERVGSCGRDSHDRVAG